jgi:rhodanese-related sulfurtransferase
MKNITGAALIIFLVLGGFTCAAATEEYAIIPHTRLKEMVDRDLREFVLVDARNPEEYMEAHIPGAINIPEKEFDRLAGMLPAAKEFQLVFYCNGVKCGKSRKSALKAAELGYVNVFVYAEGMPVWEEAGYPFYKGPDYEKRIETTKVTPGELLRLLESEPQNIEIVDVRDREEFAAGHVPGAVNLPLKEFALGSGKLDKKNKIIVYCNSGGRSYGAYRKLMRLGYTDIYQAIFADWKEQGYPVAD